MTSSYDVLAQYMYMCINTYMYILRYKNLLRNTNTTLQRYNVIKTTCKCLSHINSSYFLLRNQPTHKVNSQHFHRISSDSIRFHRIYPIFLKLMRLKPRTGHLIGLLVVIIHDRQTLQFIKAELMLFFISMDAATNNMQK